MICSLSEAAAVLVSALENKLQSSDGISPALEKSLHSWSFSRHCIPEIGNMEHPSFFGLRIKPSKVQVIVVTVVLSLGAVSGISSSGGRLSK